ncbi:MAG: class I SAM-dependent methyltransferase [Anaerolineales bacterium]|uniref:class I SAM-dependent methyltransferase n=1 Tax=Candidatus Villigracilis proximus TaxID=3140683 RepID=UPI003136444B|nr:class I SAM-dependent methyltransferase [Anaerolineales bacterium]
MSALSWGTAKKSEFELFCARDNLLFKQEDGIWRFLLPERESHYARFIRDYETVRRFEGRFSPDASYYRALPFKDTSRKFSADWKIRAASFGALQKILTAESTVLDMGSGNGWLSNRLSLSGYDVCAVDLLLNPEDGLGACTHYQSRFTRTQSEFIHLPFLNAAISTVIFNASFHYSENYEETLTESLRVLSPNGKVVIMDSPIYHNADSGKQMVAERKSAFLSRYGFASKLAQKRELPDVSAHGRAGENTWHCVAAHPSIVWSSLALASVAGASARQT